MSWWVDVSHDLSKDALQRDTEMENVWAKVRYPEDRPSSNTHLLGEARESTGMYRLEAIIKNISQSWRKTWIILHVWIIFSFLNIFIEVQLIYNVSGVQQSDSVFKIYIHIHTYMFFFRFFSIIDHYKILNIVPCAIQ